MCPKFIHRILTVTICLSTLQSFAENRPLSQIRINSEKSLTLSASRSNNKKLSFQERLGSGFNEVSQLQAENLTKKLGGMDGGGGGGLLINGKIYTLAEAGLRINEKEIFYLDQETITEVQKILEKIGPLLPTKYKGFFKKIIFGNKHEYRKTEVVDPSLYLRIKEEYKSYIDDLEVQSPFLLAAYTHDQVTELLPDFFSADPKTRAIYLFHEAAFYFHQNNSLENVLMFEIALVNLLNTNPSSIQYPVKIWNFYKSLHGIGVLSFGHLNALYIKQLNEMGKTINLGMFLDPEQKLGHLMDETEEKYNDCDSVGDMSNGRYGPLFNTSNMSVTTSSGVHSDFAKRFLNTEIEIDVVNYALSTGGFDRSFFGCHLKNRNPSNFVLVYQESRKQYTNDNMDGYPQIVIRPLDSTLRPYYKKSRIKFLTDDLKEMENQAIISIEPAK